MLGASCRCAGGGREWHQGVHGVDLGGTANDHVHRRVGGGGTAGAIVCVGSCVRGGADRRGTPKACFVAVAIGQASMSMSPAPSIARGAAAAREVGAT